MLASRKWLNQLVAIEQLSTKELAFGLTKSGHEVEEIFQLSQLKGLIIGEVSTLIAHPDSDHLHVATVNIKSEKLTIVCGAPNIALGQKVIVAPIGTELPKLTIKASKIRGIESQGMLCSLAELDLPEHTISKKEAQGICVLPKEAPIGADPIAYLGLDDDILDISLTPNRSDLLSMLNLAREISAIFKVELHTYAIKPWDLKGKPTTFKVSSQSANCPLFLARVVHNVTIRPSSLWIQQYLRAAGMNPINNIVDISNLMMLWYGQPNHMYDKRFFQQDEIVVRDDISQEVETLDGDTVKLEKGDIVITSQKQPIGIGGIKGLGNSMIVEDTCDIVIEIALFDPIAITKTSRRLNIQSEAALRNSKPYDPLAPYQTMGHILALLESEAGIDLSRDIEDVVVYHQLADYQKPMITISKDEVNQLLGTDFTLADMVAILERLQLAPTVSGEIMTCQIPSYRHDLAIKEDLIEEIMRLMGYENLPSTLPKMPLTVGFLTEQQQLIRQIEAYGKKVGAMQVMTYTLVDEAKLQDTFSQKAPYELLSPLSSSRKFVRNNLQGSLIEMLLYNINHRNNNQLYFEEAMVYSQKDHQQHLAFIGSGIYWQDRLSKQVIYYDYRIIKGILLGLLHELAIDERKLQFIPLHDNDNLHPYRSAKILADNQLVGIIGELHPQLNIEHGIYCELNMSDLFKMVNREINYQKVAKMPIIERDLALVKDKKQPLADIRAVMWQVAKEKLAHLELFDIFDLADDKQSVAFHLTFSAYIELGDKEINQLIEQMIQKLQAIDVFLRV